MNGGGGSGMGVANVKEGAGFLGCFVDGFFGKDGNAMMGGFGDELLVSGGGGGNYNSVNGAVGRDGGLIFDCLVEGLIGGCLFCKKW